MSGCYGSGLTHGKWKTKFQIQFFRLPVRSQSLSVRWNRPTKLGQRQFENTMLSGSKKKYLYCIFLSSLQVTIIMCVSFSWRPGHQHYLLLPVGTESISTGSAIDQCCFNAPIHRLAFKLNERFFPASLPGKLITTVFDDAPIMLPSPLYTGLVKVSKINSTEIIPCHSYFYTSYVPTFPHFYIHDDCVKSKFIIRNSQVSVFQTLFCCPKTLMNVLRWFLCLNISCTTPQKYLVRNSRPSLFWHCNRKHWYCCEALAVGDSYISNTPDWNKKAM